PLVYGPREHPPLLLAATGTNGETAVSHRRQGTRKQLGLVMRLNSTAERQIGDLRDASKHTAPEAREVQGRLVRMRESEVRAVVLEVSARAISRHRVDGLVCDVVAFINLSHAHLDDYADMEQYFEAQLPLFEPERAKRAVVSLDTPWGQRVVE